MMPREAELDEAIRKAVSAADKIILDASDGSSEETDLLTARLAEAFVDKVMMAANRVYMTKQFREEGERGS